ncbi:MAG TPA: polysaccharide biosynthesis C-terminal domain-containing protein, partial [Sporosarcina psychrophila]|nr:polysaccharide biosynthesis C-terminal domain-containing protein [Sporosarcina psychrophila]
LSLILPLTAMLQGAGRVKVPTLLLIGGLVIKIIANQPLVPVWDVAGAAIAGNIGFVAITVGLLLYFKKIWRIRLAPARFYGWVIVASVCMIAVVLPWMIVADGFLFDKLPNRVGATLIALTSVAAGASIFLFVIMKSRIMAEKEWFLLPFGKRLATLQLQLNKSRK